MVSASAEAKHAAVTHEQAFSSLANPVQQLTTVIPQLAPLSSPLLLVPNASSSPPPRPTSELCFGGPELYAVEPKGCNPFLANCTIFFAQQPLTFTTEKAKVAFTIN